MRTTLTMLIGFAALAVLVVAQTASTAPDALLERGIASYRGGQYADAAKDLALVRVVKWRAAPAGS